MLDFNLRKRIQNDPYYRFRSRQEIRLAAQLGIRIDVNQAGVDDWLRLPGLSIHQARSLCQLTQSGFQLYSLADLAAVLCVPIARIQPWEPILSFQYYDPMSLEVNGKLNLNTATLEELTAVLPHQGDLCQQIIDVRSQIGAFRNFADLQARLRLNPAQVSDLIHQTQV